MNKINYEIRPIERSEWEMGMQLCWDTFLIYEAPEYERRGIDSFHDFVKGRELKSLFVIGEYQVYGAFLDDVIVGIVSIRKRNHISLLFVEAKYHHMGIATALLNYVFAIERSRSCREMTVNSSPYAVMFYHKLGFVDLDREIATDGIRYTPMVIRL